MKLKDKKRVVTGLQPYQLPTSKERAERISEFQLAKHKLTFMLTQLSYGEQHGQRGKELRSNIAVLERAILKA